MIGPMDVLMWVAIAVFYLAGMMAYARWCGAKDMREAALAVSVFGAVAVVVGYTLYGWCV